MKEKARIGVIGAGWWAVVNHIPVLKALPDCEIVAVNRLGKAELADVQKTFGIARGFEDYREMLDAVPMDGVVVSSPHVLHFEHARAALAKGCHVLVEKPLTTSAADARALVALAEKAGREIVVAYGWNFRPWVEEARKLTAAVGRIEHVVLQMANALEDLFAGQPMKETEGAMFRPPPSTWADPKRAGGFGWGQLVHALGLFFRIADLAPAEVFAVTGKSPAGVDYYDAAAVRFGNGASGSLSGSATLPKGRPVQIDLRIFGSEGMLAPRHRARAPGTPPARRPRYGRAAEARRRRLYLRGAAAGARRPLSRQTGAERRPRPGRPARRRSARRNVPLGRERPDGAGVMNADADCRVGKAKRAHAAPRLPGMCGPRGHASLCPPYKRWGPA